MGIHGATRQSWSRNNIRQVYAEIKSKNPRANCDEMVQLLSERMREDDDAMKAGVEYIVINCEEAQEGYAKRVTKPAPEPAPEQIAQRQKTVAAHVDRSLEAVTKVLLLNLEMPNGKRMRYCSGAEMAKFGKAYGRIAKKVGSTKMVGSVLNEKEVRALMI